MEALAVSLAALLLTAGTLLFAALTLRSKADGTEVELSLAALRTRVSLLETKLRECNKNLERESTLRRRAEEDRLAAQLEVAKLRQGRT